MADIDLILVPYARFVEVQERRRRVATALAHPPTEPDTARVVEPVTTQADAPVPDRRRPDR